MKIGFIADIHEDIIRLKEALQVLEKNKCDKIICLGDFIGYSVPHYGFLKSRNAHEVIALIKEKCDLVVAGNHDLYAIRKLPKYKAGFNYPKNWYSLDFQTRQKISKDKVYLYEDNELSALLTKEDKEYIQNLPEFSIQDFDGLKVFISHWTYPDLVGTTTFEPAKPEEFKEHFEFIQKHGCKLSICGHDHRRVFLFSPEKMHEIPFGKTKLTNNQTGIYCPCVANGTFANGVMIQDTKKMEIEMIPLNTPLHKKQDWRKL